MSCFKASLRALMYSTIRPIIYRMPSLTPRAATVIAVLAAAAVAFIAPATASAGELRTQVNALRTRSGIAPVTGSDAAAAHVSARLAASGGSGMADGRSGRSWAALSGRTTTEVGFFTWVRGGSLDAAVAGSPPVLALLLDPRVRTLDVATAGARETIAVTVDPSARFPGAVPAQRAVDPLGPAPPAWVAPPGSEGSAIVQLRLHGRWTAFEAPLWPSDRDTRVTAPTGAVLVRTNLGWTLGGIPFGTRMRLLTAVGPSGGVPVKSLPAAVRRRSFAFRSGMAGARRRRILRAVRHANRPVRRLLAQVDGLTAFRAAPLAAGVAGETGPDPHGDGFGYLVTMSAVSFRLPRRSFELAVLHELGHVVQMAGLDRSQSLAADRAIPRGGRCKRSQHPVAPTGSCAPRDERIADTFAKWALNSPLDDRHRVRSPGAAVISVLRACIPALRAATRDHARSPAKQVLLTRLRLDAANP